MRSFHLTIGGRRYAVSVEREEGGRLRIVVDGEVHVVEVEENAPAPRAAPSPRPAARPAPMARPAASGGGGTVLAPLPGVVLSVEVAEGQEVQPGDRLLILEAMKMENVISADGGGTVRAVHVRKGDKVEAGQSLMEIG